MLKDLSEILDFFGDLSRVDTERVKPSFHPFDLKNVMRKDQVEESLPKSKALANASRKKDGYFIGPKAI